MKWMTDITYIVIFMIKKEGTRNEAFIGCGHRGLCRVALTDKTHGRKRIPRDLQEDDQKRSLRHAKQAHEAGCG